MNKQFSILAGAGIILIGLMALGCNVVGALLGLSVWEWGPWRLWPLIVVCFGLLFIVPPALTRGLRALGLLFIPGAPILTTGAILLFASVFGVWNVWEWLWPLEVMALATGFLLAAIYMRTVWLVVPAIIIGANGLLLQFCATTDWWGVWEVLWTIEPLAIGVSLLVISGVRRSTGLFVAGLVVCGLAGLGLAGSLFLSVVSDVFPAWWVFRLMGPATLILIGSLVLVWGLFDRSPTSGLAAE
jgi:hypothetical protein